MTKDSHLLDHLFKTAAELNDVADALNEHYETLEDAFNAAGVGCNVFVVANDWAADDPTTASLDFGYGRIGGRWGFIIRRKESVRLLEAPRRDRVRCVELLPGLVTALLILTRARRDEAREAEKLLAALVAAIPKT